MWGAVSQRFVVLALLMCFAAPGWAQEPTPTLKVCWPKEFAPFEKSASQERKKGVLHVYLDGSASMAGFMTVPKAGADGLSIMSSLLPALTAHGDEFATKTLIYRIGDGQSSDKAQVDKPLTEAQIRDATRAGWYAGKDAPLDLPLLQALKRPPEDLTVVVTDLFLSDAGPGDSFYALRRPLVDALKERKAIGLLGIRHNFNGTVFDIPGKNGEYSGALTRPLMMLLVGEPGRVLAFKHRIETEFLAERKDQSKFVVFTGTPVEGFAGIGKMGDRYLSATTPTLAFDPSLTELRIPKLEMSKSAPALTGTLDIAPLLTESSPPPTGVETRVRLWSLEKRTGDCDARWEAAEIASAAAMARIRGNVIEFEILPPEAREDADSGRYLVVASLTLSGQEIPTWPTEWGFTQEKAEAIVAGKPTFFPTLNLGRLAKALIDASAEVRRDMQIGELAIAINLRH